VSPSISRWLLDKTSLTQRLRESCPHAFDVDLLQQTWAKPTLNEAQRLTISRFTRALVRQVHLLCNNNPVVFARTVTPRGKPPWLTKLGKKPLGPVLFADKSMRRTEMEIARIEPGQLLYRLATRHLPQENRVIWGRRSVFYLSGHPLLVCEIFLPSVITLNKAL